MRGASYPSGTGAQCAGRFESRIKETDDFLARAYRPCTTPARNAWNGAATSSTQCRSSCRVAFGLRLLSAYKQLHRLSFNPPKKGKAMNTLIKLGCPFAVAVAVALTSVPAHAQLFREDELGQMKQYAPFLEMMKQRMGKKRYGEMMQRMGPMMAGMTGNGGNGSGGGFGAGFGGGGNAGDFDFGGFSGGNFGDIANMFGSGQGMGDIMGMINGFTGRHSRRAWRRRHAD